MTPAEHLASTKTRQRPRRNECVKMRHAPVWSCRVREVRERLNLSLADVAKAVGLSVTGLFQVEHGGDPMLSTASKLAAFFGKRVEFLWPERTQDNKE